MRRKIFSEKNYDVSECVLPYEKFKPFSDREQGFYLRPEYREQAIEAAEKLLDKKYGVLTATDYMLCLRTGNRQYYEGLYFERREDIMTLVVAEAYECAGRFTDKILDLVWMILEESTWVIPAHINPRPGDMTHVLPYSYDGPRNYLDLFAGATGALIAWVWYICRDRFEEISPVINRRIIDNLYDRIIFPFVENTDEMAWMGNGKFNWINNWCPWVISNILTVCALTVKDKKEREHVVRIALDGLDKFTAIYEDDGACDEGPVYWGAACGALYNACLVLYDMTGGKIDAFKDPLMIRMGEFFPKAYICRHRYLNFSDAASKLVLTQRWGYDWGKLSGSTLMQNFWEYACESREELPPIDRQMPYRYFRTLGAPDLEHRDFKASTKDFFQSLDLSIQRDSDNPEQGLYLSLKGYHNAASHNHLDVGNFVIFCDGKPIFIDAGVGTYTARTFNSERYTIWSMRSEYHNIPTVNGVDQQPGKRFAAKNAVYDENSGSFSLELAGAYPEKAQVESFIRKASLEGSVAKVEDEILSSIDGEVVFNLMTVAKPEKVAEGRFEVNGAKIAYEPSLDMSVEEVDCSWPETRVIPEKWDTDTIYRIRLRGTLEAGKKQKFTLEVTK